MAEIDQTLANVEKAIMPTIASMLDALIDSAQGARPGIDGLRYATDIRMLADQAQRASREIGELMVAAHHRKTQAAQRRATTNPTIKSRFSNSEQQTPLPKKPHPTPPTT